MYLRERHPSVQSNIVIEALGSRHRDTLASLMGVVAQESRYLGSLEGPAKEWLDAAVVDSEENGGVHLIARTGENVIGWCSITRYPLPALQHCGSLFAGVLDVYRKRGVGKRLIRDALNMGHAAGMRRIDLEVAASNHAAIALYRKLGFQVEGLKRHAYMLDKCDDILIMGLLLDECA